MTWFDNISWNPFEKKPIICKAEEPVRPDELLTSSIQEPEPGTYDWMYMDTGGEG